MAVAGKPSSSLHLEECDFTELIWSKIFYLVLFSCMNCHLTTKYKAENLLKKLFETLENIVV